MLVNFYVYNGGTVNRLLITFLLLIPAGVGAQPRDQPLTLKSQDRILVLSPHPDDDILGCGGVIQSAVAAKLPVKVVYLTNGDNYEWAFLAYKKHPVLRPSSVRAMGLVRHGEAITGEQVLGVTPENLVFLGYPDWGTERIWLEHWGAKQPPFLSMLTRVRQVPYENAFRPGAPYKGEAILADLERIMRDFKPTKIFVSHPGDAHRDHRSFFLFAQVALWNVRAKVRPEVFPFLIHHPRWPSPRGLIKDRELTLPGRLEDFTWSSHSLTSDQVETKISALRAHRTQLSKDHEYLYSFMAINELFFRLPELTLHPALQAADVTKAAAAKADVPSDLEPVEVAWNSLHREGDYLVLTLAIPHRLDPLARTIRINAFGYRHEKPFAEMPKIRIIVSRRGCRLLDQSKPLPLPPGLVLRRDGHVTLRLPLALLGHPEKLIGTVWSHDEEESSFDWRAWRVIDLQPAN